MTSDYSLDNSTMAGGYRSGSARLNNDDYGAIYISWKAGTVWSNPTARLETGFFQFEYDITYTPAITTLQDITVTVDNLKVTSNNMTRYGNTFNRAHGGSTFTIAPGESVKLFTNVPNDTESAFNWVHNQLFRATDGTITFKEFYIELSYSVNGEEYSVNTIIYPDFPRYDLEAEIYSGNSVTDEENPMFHYYGVVSSYGNTISLDFPGMSVKQQPKSNLRRIEAALEIDGGIHNPEIPYREIINDQYNPWYYTFKLTEAERIKIRNIINDIPKRTFHYITKTIRDRVYPQEDFSLTTESRDNKTYYIVNYEGRSVELPYGNLIYGGEINAADVASGTLYNTRTYIKINTANGYYNNITGDDNRVYICVGSSDFRQITKENDFISEIRDEFYFRNETGVSMITMKDGTKYVVMPRNFDYIYINEVCCLYSIEGASITIIGAEPQLFPKVEDVNSTTLALTGDKDTVVRYESMVEFETGAVGSKSATIESQSVKCGTKVVYDSYHGVIDNVESADFIFTATDSRGLKAQATVTKNIVEYIKPTVNQHVSIALSSEVGATVILKISGNYYNGSFGLVDNTLKLEVRHTQNDGTMGEWVEITDGLIPEFNGNTYNLEISIEGFNYDNEYTFQCRATDVLNFVETAQYTTKLLPIFDWSLEDFNFNVPVNIGADNLNMHDNTIIRHSAETNNTVLSANNGHIYIRPGGTSETDGEVIIYPDGSTEFKSAVTHNSAVSFKDSITIGDNILADYVVASGSSSMGSNGTWYWRKWNSGKAECYGCRNYGRMGITTALGSMYKSAPVTQDFPAGLFNNTPDVIHKELKDIYAVWVVNNDPFIDGDNEVTGADRYNTGEFIVVSPLSRTLSSSYISIHAIGRWK